jgi:penicillin amidase
MKYVRFIFFLLLNSGLVFVLNSRSILPLPLGKFLSVQEGIWQNAESVNASYNEKIKIAGMEGKAEVYFDDRLVPHIFAEKENDAYFVQGYLHAKFRLWQMEFQTHAAAGRISEIVGDKGINFDKTQRRIGMVFAAENALGEIEKDPLSKAAIDAYTSGINQYISSLQTSQLPIEYKMLGYQPEAWTNLKTALFTKQMTNNLAGYDRDFEFTNALKVLGEENFRILYSDLADSLYPVIPKGTIFQIPNITLKAPETADSLYFKRKDTIQIAEEFKPNPSNGSNNWVLDGSKTKSGNPILSNDPHLGLTLPSIWYEIQIHTPEYNSYGVSFPGIPGVVIGFNDNIAFGFTNAGRDVKDYYQIQFKNDQRKEYWFDKKWKSASQRIEQIKVKNHQLVKDTVSYTIFGPVTYDKSFKTDLSESQSYALRWVAHDSSNILKMWLLLNRAKNYNDYKTAIGYFNVPGQNMIFASKTGDIALWQQASFPLRWKDQGLFVMPGTDSSYMWNGYIPSEENPHIVNPIEGYISSANQRAADTSYPYFIPGNYEVYRAITINRKLAAISNATISDMMALQNDNYNVFAEEARPILLQFIDKSVLTKDEKKYLGMVENWNLMNDPKEKGTVCFVAWWDSLHANVFNDELNQSKVPLLKPEKFVLLEALEKNSAFKFVDNINTPIKETLTTQVTSALKKAAKHLAELEKEDKIEWAKFKNTTVYHLLKTNAMAFARTGLMNGGGNGIINASQHDHGPSWRMIVELTTPTKAFGIYPGGQDGNPGSKFYDNFVDKWTKGEYYALWVMNDNDINDKRVKWKMTFSSN